MGRVWRWIIEDYGQSGQYELFKHIKKLGWIPCLIQSNFFMCVWVLIGVKSKASQLYHWTVPPALMWISFHLQLSWKHKIHDPGLLCLQNWQNYKIARCHPQALELTGWGFNCSLLAVWQEKFLTSLNGKIR